MRCMCDVIKATATKQESVASNKRSQAIARSVARRDVWILRKAFFSFFPLQSKIFIMRSHASHAHYPPPLKKELLLFLPAASLVSCPSFLMPECPCLMPECPCLMPECPCLMPECPCLMLECVISWSQSSFNTIYFVPVDCLDLPS